MIHLLETKCEILPEGFSQHVQNVGLFFLLIFKVIRGGQLLKWQFNLCSQWRLRPHWQHSQQQ